jgi:hypothetical protein
LLSTTRAISPAEGLTNAGAWFDAFFGVHRHQLHCEPRPPRAPDTHKSGILERPRAEPLVKLFLSEAEPDLPLTRANGLSQMFEKLSIVFNMNEHGRKC